MQFAGGSATNTPLVKLELEYQIKRLSHHPSVAMWDGCNECGGGGDYMNFIMPVVAAVDTSRPVWPSCPAAGWISGVDRLTSRPNGKTLQTGAGGGGKMAGEGRPSGYPFTQEAHGPYTAFMGMNMADTVMPLHHAAEISPPTLVPANLGAGEEGWYRSEFGCVAWSSFESMSAEMPSTEWSMLSAGAKNRNWNPSNVIATFFGAWSADAMLDSGEAAFKRQLYQSMIGQALFLKTEIEAWRSQNVWGTTFCEYLSAPPPPRCKGGCIPLRHPRVSVSLLTRLSPCSILALPCRF